MPLPQEIQEALDTYDNNKGFWRRLFRRDQAAIRALRSLKVNDQTNLLKIYQCFIENLPKPTQASYQVYQALLTYLDNIDFCDVPEIIDQLHFDKLIKHINLDVLNNLNARQFNSLASILKKLKLAELCTPQNLASIIPYFEAPEMLSIIEAMLNTYERLNQEKLIHLFKLLEELYPEISLNHVNADQSAIQIASALILLDQTELLTCDNRSKLWATENQFLLRNEAYPLVWRPLETYLPQLENIDERQSVFDQLINLSQQENPEEKIESLIQELNQKLSSSSHAYRPRANTNTSENKYNTAPPASRRNNRSSLTLKESHLVRQPTI